MRSGRFALDFVQFPVDLYADPARAGLLDPDAVRMRQIIARWPCIWRGSLLSLGSVEDPGDPAPDPLVARRLRGLLETSRATALVEPIGFRVLAGHDLGRPQRLPYTRAAAAWIAARWRAASDALGVPLLLRPAGTEIAGMPDEIDGFAHLRMIADLTGCEFAFDVADLSRLAKEAGVDEAEAIRRVAGLPVAMLTLGGDDEDDWIALARLRERTSPRAIVVRRSKYLFPIDAIGGALRRAESVLGSRPALARNEFVATRGPLEPEPVEALRRWQLELMDACSGEGSTEGAASFAMRAKAWQSWQKRLGETHAGQQIRKFLARDP